MHAPSFCLARAAVPLAFVLALVVGGCSASTSPIDDDTGAGGSATSATGGGMGGMGEGGEGGGEPSLCEQDCSKIGTQQCLKAVCNDGLYPGPVGQCVVVDEAAGTSCEDGLFCTSGDTCQAGTCVGGPPNDCGMAVGACEGVVCNEASKACSLQPANQGSSCQPADLCQVGGTCNASGQCVGTPKDCFFAPITDCEVAICNPANGVCEGHPDATKDGQTCVLGGDLCMVNKTCNAGQCIGGAPKDCSSLDVGCQNGVCNQATGQCVADPVPAGNQCNTGTDQCNIGICDAVQNCIPNPVMDGTQCDDFNICTTGDFCTAGVCSGAAVPNCTTYFQANFETGCPPPGWTLSGTWECGSPSAVGPAAAFEGLYLIGTDLDANYQNNLSYANDWAQTPPIGLGGATQPILSYFHYVDTEGSSFDGYNVKISTDGGNTFSVLTSVVPPYNLTVDGQPAYGGHLNAWQQVTADLSPYIGQQVILRFSFRTDVSFVYPGIYIDAISVSEVDAVPLLITTPSIPDALESIPYTFFLERVGGSANATWSITGGSNIGWLSIDPLTGELFGTPAIANLGPASVTVAVAEPSNPNNFDSATFNFNVQQTVWAETFEGACPNGWTLTGDWQCGMVASGPGSAFSGSQAIATILAGSYNNNQTYAGTTASSPAINLAGTTAPLLRFWVWYQTETNYDGFNVKVSSDGGATYTLLTSVMPAYNQNLASEQCWAGTTGGWVQHSASLSAFVGQQIHLRFAFRSDGTVVYPGVYIDDVTITD